MFRFILNLPYTIIGILLGLISMPRYLKLNKNPYFIIIHIKKFWWEFGYMKNARAMTIGHTILLSPKIKEKDLEHEIIHVKQYEKMPIIYPILYYIELYKKGYRNNKYEEEAYRLAGNIYEGK